MNREVSKEVWKILMYVSSVISAVSHEDLTGAEKKNQVVEETLNYLRSFDIPLPEYIVRAMLNQLVQYLYDMLKERNALPL